MAKFAIYSRAGMPWSALSMAGTKPSHLISKARILIRDLDEDQKEVPVEDCAWAWMYALQTSCCRTIELAKCSKGRSNKKIQIISQMHSSICLWLGSPPNAPKSYPEILQEALAYSSGLQYTCKLWEVSWERTPRARSRLTVHLHKLCTTRLCKMDKNSARYTLHLTLSSARYTSRKMHSHSRLTCDCCRYPAWYSDSNLSFLSY